MFARHTYSDFVRGPTGEVGLIVATINECDRCERSTKISDILAQRFMVKWHDGKVSQTRDFDLITEYEYYEVFDPKRCGLSIDEIVTRSIEGRQECFFTGGFFVSTISKQPSEDFFS